jgi:signal transduction histidine kinase/HPt (histidine-containing phosphotransfer) domain-containing protein
VARIRRRRFQLVAGVLAAFAASVAHLFPLTLGSAASVSLETVVVAVTGLIAGWPGSAVALLFLTVVTFATGKTLGAAFLCAAIDIAVATVCVVGVHTVRQLMAADYQRRRLRRHLILHRRRLDSIRNHVGRLRRAVQKREHTLQAREAELVQIVSSHETALKELTRAHHLVDAAQRSSGHFVAMMSHEIRTPLHGLMATIDMLRDEPLSAEGRHRIGIARVSARTLLNIANDILDLSRIEAGAFPLEHEPFHLASVLREVVDEARARAESLGLRLRTTTEGSLPRSFIGDPARIKQILANLVSNALKFTTIGGVSLLESLDCTVSIAGTGAEALELLGTQTFDLVFMDCQMPGMDGYETTRRMRAVLHRYIPVVAITANAMVDDKQRCLDAGMDDFLPKPFTKSALSDLLCKWLVPGANAIGDGEIAERIAELPVLAAAVFDELWQSLQWRLSPLRKIYESFLSVAHETLDMLEVPPSDSAMLARRLHTLLGSAGMVGARQVERVTAWLAEAAQADRRTELESGRAELAEAVRRFEEELERRLDALTQ